MRREEAVQELQRVGALLGKTALSMRDFARNGSVNTSTIARTFGSWNAAIEAAGLKPLAKGRALPDDRLRAEFKRVAELLSRSPSRNEFAAHANISPGAYERRFGKWSAAVAEYKSEPVAAPSTRKGSIPSPRVQMRERVRMAHTSRSRPAFGPPLNFRELRHEPLDEQGVVFLFGMVAKELGFLVEAVRQSFPDCIAKRAVRAGRKLMYESVRIEFEYKSSTFREHGHDPSGCDLVVCWEHDWLDCPVEVLELKTAIQRLSSLE